MTSVLIADDHPAYRRGLCLMLSGVEDLTIAGEAETGLRAVALAEELRPDVVVMDLRMPGLDGIEATRRVTGRPEAPVVIVLTMFDDDDSVFSAMRAGARRQGQCHHRPRTHDQLEDRAQPRLQHLHQAAGVRPGRRHRQSPPSRASERKLSDASDLQRP